MNVSDAIAHRISIRAFTGPGSVGAPPWPASWRRPRRAPSGGNLQPWRVYALAGEARWPTSGRGGAEPLGRDAGVRRLSAQPSWDPFRTRRFENGEQLYAAVGVPREDKGPRLRWLARNTEFFGAPRRPVLLPGPQVRVRPQWADLGMYMQNVMLLAVEGGLDTCAQEFWARYPQTVAKAGGHAWTTTWLFSGMAWATATPTTPSTPGGSTRDPVDVWCELKGFEA